jgi:hypothetical protein
MAGSDWIGSGRLAVASRPANRSPINLNGALLTLAGHDRQDVAAQYPDDDKHQCFGFFLSQIVRQRRSFRGTEEHPKGGTRTKLDAGAFVDLRFDAGKTQQSCEVPPPERVVREQWRKDRIQ